MDGESLVCREALSPKYCENDANNKNHEKRKKKDGKKEGKKKTRVN